ncbi:MAG: DUF1573 domain-containing protein, partial [Phycisphaerales bacterium]
MPPVRVDPASKDFGFVMPKTLNKIDFKLWNTSDKPITVAAVNPSCKCTTTTDIVGKTIEPGAFIELGAAMEAGAAVGPKAANVKVLIDGFGRPLELALRADVTLPIKLTPGYINAVGGRSEQGRIVVESTDQAPFHILSTHGFEPQFVGFDPAKDEPRNKYVIEYDLTKFAKGTIPRYFIIETDHPACPVADALVRHDTVTFNSGVRGIKDFRGSLGLMQPGVPATCDAQFHKIAPGTKFTAAESKSPDFTAELVGQTEDGEDTLVTIKITPREGLKGLVYGPVNLRVGDRFQEFIVFGRIAGPPAGAPPGGTAPAPTGGAADAPATPARNAPTN